MCHGLGVSSYMGVPNRLQTQAFRKHPNTSAGSSLCGETQSSGRSHPNKSVPFVPHVDKTMAACHGRVRHSLSPRTPYPPATRMPTHGLQQWRLLGGKS